MGVVYLLGRHHHWHASDRERWNATDAVSFSPKGGFNLVFFTVVRSVITRRRSPFFPLSPMPTRRVILALRTTPSAPFQGWALTEAVQLLQLTQAGRMHS